MFEDLINRDGNYEGTPRKVEKKIEKTADLVEFEFVPGVGMRRVDPMFTQPGGNPKPQDGTRQPENRASGFPMTASIVERVVEDDDDSVTPMDPYEYDPISAGTIAPQFMPLPAGESEMFSPSNFKKPVPMDRPEGPAAVRLGDAYVVKSVDRADEGLEN